MPCGHGAISTRLGKETHLGSFRPTRPRPHRSFQSRTPHTDFCNRNESRAHPPVMRHPARPTVTRATLALSWAAGSKQEPKLLPTSRSGCPERVHGCTEAQARAVTSISCHELKSHAGLDSPRHPTAVEAAPTRSRERASRGLGRDAFQPHERRFSFANELPSTKSARAQTAPSITRGGSATSPGAARRGVPATFCENASPASRCEIGRAHV